MKATSLVVKLANGGTTKPMGVLHDIKIKTFEFSYRVWFVVMDFCNQPNSYDIILGRPFMRTARLVHDWSLDSVYIRKDEQVTQVDLKTWKSHPMYGHLFVAESDTTRQSTSVNVFQPCNENVLCEEHLPRVNVEVLKASSRSP